MKTTLNDFHKKITRIIKYEFDQTGEVPGTLFAPTPNNTVIVCCKPFDNEKEKILVYELYAIILAVKGITLYSFVSEMWFAPEKPGPFLMPSQQSDRREGIFISTRDKDNVLFDAYEIIRPENTLTNLDYSDDFTDQINLFGRVYPERIANSPMETFAKEFDAMPKPKWYVEIGADEL